MQRTVIPRFCCALVVVALLAPFHAAAALDESTVEALTSALDDERHAIALYRAVLERHAGARPFSNIVQAEVRHANHLLELFERHGIEAPADPWESATIEAPETLVAACELAIGFERENAALYDRILPHVTEPDVREVLDRLRLASLERHLPAFERCVSRKGGGGHGAKAKGGCGQSGDGCGKGCCRKGGCGGGKGGRGEGKGRGRGGEAAGGGC